MKRPRSLAFRLRRAGASKRRVALLVLLLGCFAGGAAYAYWTTQGTGSGSATAGTLEPVTIENVAFSGRLYPGGSAPVTITVNNPNAFSVTVSSLTAGSVTSDKAGCGGSNTSVTLNLGGLQTATIIPGTQALMASASMGLNSVSACQGAMFSTSLNLGVQK